MTITATQLRTLALLNAGYASEVQFKSSFVLSWAMTYKADGTANNNSGYSVGTLQSDLGQRPYLAGNLVHSYYQWAGSDATRLVGRTEAQLTAVMQEQGKGKSGLVANLTSEDLSKRPLSSDEMAKFNTFLQTAEGRQAVWSADLTQISKLEAYGQRVMASQSYQALTTDAERVNVLTAAMKLYNQAESWAANRTVGDGDNLAHLMETRTISFGEVASFITTLVRRNGQVVSDKDNYIKSGFEHAMNGAELYNKILTSNTPLSPWLKDLGDQDLSQTSQAMFASDPRFQVLERVFRDTGAGSRFVDSLEQGKPALMTLPKGLNGQARIVGIDKAGRLFSADGNGDNFKRFSDGQWTDSSGNYPRSDLPIIKSINGKMVLALGGEQIELGDTAIAQVNINGTDVTLDASKAGQYAFMDDGVFIRASLSVDLRQESGEVLTGEFAGSTYNRTWRQGNPVLQMGFAPDDRTLGGTLDTRTVLTDGQGKTTTIDTSPVKMTIDGQERVIGYHAKTTVEQNGSLQSANDTTVTVNPQTAERTVTIDTTVYDSVTGQLASHNASTTVTSSSGLQLQALNITYNAQGQITQTSLTELQVNGTQATTVRDSQGNTLSTSTLQTFDDGSAIAITTYPSGTSTSLTTNADGTLFSREITIPKGIGSETSRYNGAGALQSITTRQGDDDGNTLVSVTTGAGTTTSAYDPGNQLISENFTPAGALSNFSNAQTATVFSDINSLIGAIQSGQPIPALASGVRLLNDLNPGNANLGAANTVAAGVLSFYNLYNALNSGDGFAKVNATLSAINYANIALNASATGAFAAGSAAASLNTTLNGSGLAGGAPGILPALGLISAIKAGDPIGAAMSIGTLVQGSAFLTTNPVGWALIGVQLLRSFLDKGPPDAWGVANVSFGPGITNYLSQVNTTGENFGPERARGQLQGTLDALTGIISQTNATNPDSRQHLGLIPQRMPSLNYRASEFADKGYSVTDIDALTGAQRFHNIRFDDSGQVFNLDPNSITPELRAMLSLTGAPNYPQLNAYMLSSALQRQAIAPLWEVKTARMQEIAGDPNAGLTEEERAAKAGLGAAVDGAYVQSHPNDINASKKRIGRFMPIGIDLDRNGSVSTLTNAQTGVSFDWDGLGYQKQTGWIAGNDGFLVLDRNFNQSADNATELLSNPLVADPAKGLRSLAAFDANADGRIDASDPVYAQLKVWQDLNQDGNNTHPLQFGPYTEIAQDESGGVRELRSLADWGINAIDYSNGRYEYSSASSANGVGYGQIATQTLEAEEEGVLYTLVGAGLPIANGLFGQKAANDGAWEVAA